MAFLFKSKKAQEKAQGAMKEGPNGVAGSTASLTRSGKDEKGQSTPGSSVNNSLNSLQGGGNGPSSPDQPNGRRGPSTELAQDHPSRSMTAPPVQSNMNASLYPWSQRRITYTSSHPSPFPRYGAAVNGVASKEGDIYMMGGLINSSTVKGDLWMVEAGGGNMACYPLATTAEGPGPRVGHASLLVGNAFIVFGGDTKMEDSDVLDETLYLLNTSTRQWSRAVPLGPRPSGRYGHSLNILGSKIFVFGGQVEGYFMNDLVAFDLNQLQVPTNRWEFLVRNTDEGGPPQGLVPAPRTNHSVVTFNERLYLFGGTNGFQWFNDVWCYDPIPNAWTQLDCIGYIPAPREGHAAALVDDVMYIFGGRTEEGADLGDLAAFRITSRRWYTFQNMGPAPSPRSGHSMTTYGKNVIVMAGEPSSASREASDLATVFQLDTTKIRYPNDQQIQQTPSGERVPGRRPSGGEKSLMGANRGLTSRDGLASRDGSTAPSGDPRKVNGIPPRESVMGSPSVYARQNSTPGPNGVEASGPGGPSQPQVSAAGPSKLPRASLMQAPSGPPPQQQAPAPTQRTNGISSPSGGSRTKQTRPDRGFGPAIDTSMRSASQERDTPLSAQSRTLSPAPRESPVTKESPLINGRRTPNQNSKPAARQEIVETAVVEPAPVRETSVRSSSKTRQGRQQASLDSISEGTLRSVNNRPSSPPPPTRTGSNTMVRKGSGRNSQTVALLKELEAVKSRNAWYASELELAKKAGYNPNPSSSPLLDQRTAESFEEADRPLIEALIAMRTELANVQGSVDQQAILAAKKIAEVEKQRDAAVAEAVYAKAKLAAHGGSQSSTPQLDNEARDVGSRTGDRSSDIARKLAAALGTQKDLQNNIELLNAEVGSERRGRELAEETVIAAQQRISDLETYKQQNSSEIERLKAELHQAQKASRENAARCAEAVAAAQLLQLDKDNLESRHKDLLGNSKDNSETFDSLRDAVAASAEMKSLLERKLDEERTLREKVEEKLRKLKSEHETQTAELESAIRRLHDAEEMAEKHALEARTHKQAVLSGLDKVSRKDSTSSDISSDSEKLAAIRSQVESANAMVRKYQAAADAAAEKLRSAEERIAGLEAYQEQASREGMSVRKQLQVALRETQSLQAANSEMKFQLANQQLETNAVHVQHNTLKDLLGERGISPVGASRARGLASPQNRGDSPDQARLRDLEQQLLAAQQAHDETKQLAATREQEAESAYREKLSQLENDYQSAVHYVKGTEKMLKRMKDELAKYKTENTKMKAELEEAEDKIKASDDTPPTWEEERDAFREQIGNLQAEVKATQDELERQMLEVRRQLQTAQHERDHFKQGQEESQRQLSSSVEQARTDLAQLQQENELLEKRALDAEQKVSLLLDQVENSVDNYRRQSRQVPEALNGANPSGHTRNLSGSVSGDSMYSSNTERGDVRNSMALENLASELETLRTHWETTNKNYRLSNTFDFERPGGLTNDKIDEEKDEPVQISHTVSDWRKRLDSEDQEAATRKGAKEGSKSSEGRRAMSPAILTETHGNVI